jgi:hypothetical protein
MIEVAVELPSGERRDYRFSGVEIQVGRSPLCEVTIDVPEVSVVHGKLRLLGDQLQFEDNNSLSGTSLVRGGTRILVQGTCEVGPGDVLLLGGVTRLVILNASTRMTLGDKIQHHSWPDTVDPTAVSPAARAIVAQVTDHIARRPDARTLLIGASKLFTAVIGAEVLQVGFIRDLQTTPTFSILSGEEFRPGNLGLTYADRDVILEHIRSGGITHHPHENGHRVYVRGFGDEGDCAVALQLPPGDEPAQSLHDAGRLLASLVVAVARHEATRHYVDGLEAENHYFRDRQRQHYLFKELVTESPPMKRLYREMHGCIESDAPVLLTGEAGTGKQMVARALHHLGPRREGLLVPLHCNEDADKMAAQLLGTASTADHSGRPGIFELANGGTVYLDEIERLPAYLQAHLVRVIHEGEVRRRGEVVARNVDVRLVVATYSDLMALTDTGALRQDLFVALNAAVLHVPPLRDRREDILPLVQIFARVFARRYGTTVPTIHESAHDVLRQRAWPGNVRELQCAVESAMLQRQGAPLRGKDFWRAKKTRR